MRGPVEGAKLAPGPEAEHRLVPSFQVDGTFATRLPAHSSQDARPLQAIYLCLARFPVEYISPGPPFGNLVLCFGQLCPEYPSAIQERASSPINPKEAAACRRMARQRSRAGS